MTLLVNGSWSFPFTRTIYQGPLKVICSPGLNCYSCPASTTYCPIGTLQQLMAGIRIALENGQNFFGLYVVGTMGFWRSLWTPHLRLGLSFWPDTGDAAQIPSRSSVSRRNSIISNTASCFSSSLSCPLQLLMLSAMANCGSASNIRPAGTLEAGLPMLMLQPALGQTIGPVFYNKLTILTGFILWSILASRPFCRTTCPLGAFYSLFKKTQARKTQAY